MSPSALVSGGWDAGGRPHGSRYSPEQHHYSPPLPRIQFAPNSLTLMRNNHIHIWDIIFIQNKTTFTFQIASYSGIMNFIDVRGSISWHINSWWGYIFPDWNTSSWYFRLSKVLLSLDISARKSSESLKETEDWCSLSLYLVWFLPNSDSVAPLLGGSSRLWSETPAPADSCL